MGGSRGGFRSGESMEESRESGSADRDRDREVEGRYGVLYEQRMNPFAEVILLPPPLLSTAESHVLHNSYTAS